MYQVVFSDVDETLLNDQHCITPLTLLTIKKIQQQGIPFVIVSARSPSGIYPILKENNLVCPMICYGGGMILNHENEIIYEKGMETSLALKIINYIEANNFDIAWCIYSFDDWLVKDCLDPRIIKEEQIVKAKSRQGNQIEIKKLSKVHKILCICNHEHINDLETKLKIMFKECQIVKSSNILIEITHQNISKAFAIKKYCDLLNINIKNTIAFGDQYNDLEMLKIVGCGIAMKNAPLGIKKEVKQVTKDNNHDGIYFALSKLNLFKEL